MYCKAKQTKQKKDAQQYRHTILSALVESPYLLSRFVVVTKQYIWLVLPHRACSRIAITHAPASTSALPDNDKNDGHYNDHARPQESRHESVRSMTWLSRGTINTSFMFFLQICHWSVHQCQAMSHVTVWQTCERNIGTHKMCVVGSQCSNDEPNHFKILCAKRRINRDTDILCFTVIQFETEAYSKASMRLYMQTNRQVTSSNSSC